MSPRTGSWTGGGLPIAVLLAAALLAAVLLVAVLCLGGCTGSPRDVLPSGDGTASAYSTWRERPTATFIRFQESRGTGFSREGWEIEIHQWDRDIWVKGVVRTEEGSVPIKESLSPSEFRELWDWLGAYPLGELEVEVNRDEPPGDWRKSLEIDVIIGEDERLRSRNEWRRPPVGPPELAAIEDQLHLLLMRYTEREVQRMGREAAYPDEAEADSAARDAIREAESLLLDEPVLGEPLPDDE
jgi:hypothetical protein